MPVGFSRWARNTLEAVDAIQLALGLIPKVRIQYLLQYQHLIMINFAVVEDCLYPVSLSQAPARDRF
jgi:hypothetical protein